MLIQIFKRSIFIFDWLSTLDVERDYLHSLLLLPEFLLPGFSWHPRIAGMGFDWLHMGATAYAEFRISTDMRFSFCKVLLIKKSIAKFTKLNYLASASAIVRFLSMAFKALFWQKDDIAVVATRWVIIADRITDLIWNSTGSASPITTMGVFVSIKFQAVKTEWRTFKKLLQIFWNIEMTTDLDDYDIPLRWNSPAPLMNKSILCDFE